MPISYNGELCFQQISAKKNLPLKFRYFNFPFLWVLTPSWHHLGCQFFCQLSLVELYYRLIDLNQDSKVIRGYNKKNFKNQWKLQQFLLIFGEIRFKIVPYRSRKWKTGYLAFSLKKKLLLPNVNRKC